MEEWAERVSRLEGLAEKTVDRLTALETDVAAIRASLAALAANSATKAEVSEVKASLAALAANSATKAEVSEVKASLAALTANSATKADLSDLKASIIMWVVSAFFLTQLLPQILKLFGL